MQDLANKLEPHLQRMVDLGVSGLDIMHGQLKLDLLTAESELSRLIEEEEQSGDSMDSMERKYMEGWLEALEYLYKLTYDLSFAIADKEAGK